MIRFENVTKVYQRDPAGTGQGLTRDRARVRLHRRPVRPGKPTMPGSSCVRVGQLRHGCSSPARTRRLPMRSRVCRQMGRSSRTSACCREDRVQNVAYALQVIGKPSLQIRRTVPETLEMVGPGGMDKRLPHQPPAVSSSGSPSPARSSTAMILLADEPTGNLTRRSARHRPAARAINRTGTTIIMATHDDSIVNDLRRRVIGLNRDANARRRARHLRPAEHVTGPIAHDQRLQSPPRPTSRSSTDSITRPTSTRRHFDQSG